MKFKGLKKAAAFWASYWGILFMYLISILFNPEAAKAIAVPIVAALVTLSGVAQGWNVADNYQKSKYYNADLDKEK